MGLNDEFAPIDDTVVLESVDKQPENQEPIPASDVFDEPVVAGEVPKFSGVFQLQETQRNNVTDLAEVKSTLTRNCGVCTEDANVLNNLIPGFISDERPIGVFTQDPTKTQYEETMQSVDVELSRQVQELSSSTTEISVGYLEHTRKLRDIYTNKYPTLLARLNSSIAKLLFALGKDDIDKISYTFNNRVKWGQLMDYPVSSLIEDVVATSDWALVEEYRNTFLEKSSAKLKETLRNRSFYKTLLLVLNHRTNMIVINSELYQIDEETNMLHLYTGEQHEPSAGSLTLGNLFRTLESNSLYSYIKRLEAVFFAETDVLKVIPEQVTKINAQEESNLNPKITALVALSSMVSDVRHNTSGIMNIQAGLYQLMECLVCLIEDLAETQGVALS